jgi:hypothetical protein
MYGVRKGVDALCQRGRYVQWSEWSGVRRSRTARSVFKSLRKRFHEQLQKRECVRVCVRECAVKDRERGATRQTVIPNGGRRSDGRELLRKRLHLPREERTHVYTTISSSHALVPNTPCSVVRDGLCACVYRRISSWMQSSVPSRSFVCL